jgi:acyl dehydratase
VTTPKPILTEEQRKQSIGLESPPLVFEVEKGHVLRFADAIGDPNPLWNDERAARGSRYVGLVAPPTFLRAARLEVDLPFEAPKRRLDAGSAWEYFEPVRPGDTITCVARIEEVYERPGRLGTMLFIVTLVRYTNQRGKLAATQRMTLIRY